MTTFIQTNLNRSKEAQDLLLHQAEELGAAVCVVSEPARTPSSQQWFYSHDGLAAIYVNRGIADFPAALVARGRSSVVVRYGTIHIVSCYISPNINYAGYSNFVNELSNVCSLVVNSRTLVCGNFNAHAVSLGSGTTDFKGDILEEWTAQMDLRLLNAGNAPTFMSRQGSSIIDLTWSSPDLVDCVWNWSVRDDLESFSDHKYITFRLSESGARPYRPARHAR